MSVYHSTTSGDNAPLTGFETLSRVDQGTAFRLVPGPKPTWPGGNLREFDRDPLVFLTRCARDYGDFVSLHFGAFQVCLVSHPDLIEEILVTKNRSFVKGRGLGQTRELLGNGLLTSEGDFWRRQRRLAQPAFHMQRVAAYAQTMQDFTERTLATWQDGQALDVHQATMELTMQIAAKTLFSVDVGERTGTVSATMEVLLKVFSQRNRLRLTALLPGWVPTPTRIRYRRSVQDLDTVVYQIINERRAHPEQENHDLLAMLLEARDETGAGMSDQQLRDEVMTLFLAGHETTANALSWTWLLLAQNPQAEARLHAELDRVLAGRTPGIADLPNLTYTANVINESMRLYPPAWVIGRQAAQDVTIGGVEIQAGTGLIMSQWVMHHDPRYFQDPQAFRPERWEGDFARRIPDFAYFPFGGGPRLCIGKPFALQEAALVLAMVAQRYHLELETQQPVKPVPSITLRPRSGIRMRLMQRKSA